MRLFLFCIGLLSCVTIQAEAQPDIIADTTRPVEERIQNAIDQMTLEEKVRLCFGGERFGEVVLPGVPRLNIDPIYAADGPRGVRAGDVTVFPSGIGLAATWNPQLVEQTGQVIGTESRARGIGMVFGPAFNINRDPLGGRFFEYLTEDPYLNGKIAAAQVKGMQKEGVSACIKHFAVNSRDLNRNWYMSRVDERTLREIYLRGYEIAVKEADPWGCMTAANGLNGELCSDNEWLLNEVLKKEWGFKGLVLTDFCHSRSTEKAALAGLDIDMPWGDFETILFGKPLMEAVEQGKVPESVLNEMVRRILWVKYKTGVLDHKDLKAGFAVNTKENQEVARQAAEESMVLLKNENDFLPLDLDMTKRVVLIGPNCAQRFCILGLGGSSGAQAAYEITPLKGLENKLKGKAELCYLPLTGDSPFTPIPTECWTGQKEGNGVRATYYKRGEGQVQAVKIEPTVDFSWFNQSPVPDKIQPGDVHVVVEGKIKAPVTGTYTLKLITDNNAEFWVSDMGAQAIRNTESGVPQQNTAMCFFEAGKTYDIRIDYSQSPEGMKNATEMNYWAKENPSLRLEWALPSDEKIIAEAIAPYRDTLASADVIVFVGGTDHNLDCEGRDRTSMNFPQGQTELIRQVAAINPNMVVALMHGAPIDLPWIDCVPAVLDMFFPGMEGGTAMADLLFGDATPSGRLTFSWPMQLEDSPAYKLATQDIDNVYYTDSLMVGYRYFDTENIAPRYEFGYGLSYTTFDYGKMKLSRQGDSCIVTMKIKNSGPKEGAETVQIYVGQKNCKYTRPVHELKAFEKVFLKAGESRTISFVLDKDAFSYWNPDKKTWVRDSDEFMIEAGHSSRDIRRSAKIKF